MAQPGRRRALHTFDGEEQQLPLTEPNRGHALHGLLGWTDWQVADATDDAVSLSTELAPSAGYPHRLVLEARYALADDGLTTTVTARSRYDRSPYGVSAHPYLTAGGASLDASVLTLPADRYVETEGERLLPAGERGTSPTPPGRTFVRRPRSATPRSTTPSPGWRARRRPGARPAGGSGRLRGQR